VTGKRKHGKSFEIHRFRTEAGQREVEIRHDGTNFFAELAGTTISDPAVVALRAKIEKVQRETDNVQYKLYIDVEFLRAWPREQKYFLGFDYTVVYLSEEITPAKGQKHRLCKHAVGNLEDGYEPPDYFLGSHRSSQGQYYHVNGRLVEWTAQREAVLKASQQALLQMREKVEGIFAGSMEEVQARLDAAPIQKLLGAPATVDTPRCRLCGDRVGELECKVCHGHNCGNQDCWVSGHCKDCCCDSATCPSSDCRR
jgi:hypothetical protein